MSPHARPEVSTNAQPQNGWGFVAYSAEEIQANHARLLERNSTHRRSGYDPEASVRFVIGKALPLRGRVLDIGTGKGRFVVALARHVANLTTVDISAEEQQCARLEAAHAGVADRITFVLADARNLPWPAGSFDAVTSWNVFHHLEDPGRVFAEMLRVLKPTGKLILADFSMSGFRIMDAIHREEGRRHPHPPSRFTHWQARLHLAGFGTHRYAAWHQDLLVAGPRVHAATGRIPFPKPQHPYL
jgi:2-polyprenyl-3-methyl-5-hydroxy-6-metoxy-1,4-benzoquinol methylase